MGGFFTEMKGFSLHSVLILDEAQPTQRNQVL